MPELAAWEVLLAVARTGSLNAAARDVGVSQQAVSARIRSIEAHTGVQLVTRTARGSSLTPAGVVVAEWASRLLDVAAELDTGLAALRQDRRTHLRVSASLTIAEQLLPGWLVSLRAAAQRRGEEAPDIVLTATNSETVVEQVRDDTAELGFIESPGAPGGLRSRVIGRDELVLVVRPDHPWARRRRPITVRELHQTALVSREHGSGTRDTFTAAVAAALGDDATPPPVSLELSTTSAVRAAVLAGAGAAVLSEFAVTDDLTIRRLIRVPVTGLDLHRDLRAIWRGPPEPPAGAARDLIAHIVSGSRRL
ncbi:MAG: LysR family transcriptional regulator [Frankia sp.]